MDMDTAMEGHAVSPAEAMAEIRGHGCQCWYTDGELWAVPCGEDVDSAEVLPLDSAAILGWLGY